MASEGLDSSSSSAAERMSNLYIGWTLKPIPPAVTHVPTGFAVVSDLLERERREKNGRSAESNKSPTVRQSKGDRIISTSPPALTLKRSLKKKTVPLTRLVIALFERERLRASLKNPMVNMSIVALVVKAFGKTIPYAQSACRNSRREQVYENASGTTCA